ncbi:ROK family transcriptional regulator [Porphyrobacter sp. ULC335]|uniref:ROK family transcriptional regulator n=1 Tax=Porphyrobacter sp. ULC335 TaxID=2854260 RepID=UPI00221EC10C|nr:ROK family transcriptional regulator [Porphyrobacter sp. ULC335]UYV15389.1 ROK family protein [Porphyrobacter sp. ULC335]
MPQQSRNAVRLSGTNLERAADHNQRITLHAIRVQGTTTRVELARLTGLTTPAIANIAKRLIADDLVHEAGQVREGRGQPAIKLKLNPDACFAIGVNIDRDHIAIAIVNFVGDTLARRAIEIDFALPEDVRNFYRQSITELVAESGIDVSRLVGIGVATPDDLGSIELAGRPKQYSAWDKTDIAGLFVVPYALPVFIENDAAAAAMGEQQLGSGRRYSSAFYILISWGLGGGFFADGTYVRGADGRSGEIGFLNCRTAGGQAEPLQQWVSLSGLSTHLQAQGLKLSELFADEQSPAFTRALDSWIDGAVERLLDPILAINCLLNPSAILIGGRLPLKYLKLLEERLNASLAVHAAHLPGIAPIERAELAEDAPTVGAAILPLSHYLLPKAATLWKQEHDVEPDIESTGAWMQRA